MCGAGRTALAIAIQYGHVEVAMLLLYQCNASVAACDLTGLHMLHHAVLNVGIAKTPMLVEAVISAVGDLSLIMDYVGWTPLHAACMVIEKLGGVNDADMRIRIVQMLLAAGSPVNCCTADQVTPLMVAVFYDSEWDLLLTSRADVHARNSVGQRALEIVQQLVPRMGHVEDRSIAPTWLSPKVKHLPCPH